MDPGAVSSPNLGPAGVLSVPGQMLQEMQDEAVRWRQRYRQLYDGTPVGHLTLDEHGCILDINLVGAGLLGRPRQKLIGRFFHRLLEPGQRHKFRDHLALCFVRGRAVGTELKMNRLKRSPELFVELVSKAEHGATSAGGHYQCVLQDVTPRRRAEQAQREGQKELERRVKQQMKEMALTHCSLQAEIAQHWQTELALRASEERFRLLVDGARDYTIILLDEDGCVATWNSGAERTYGYTRGEILGRHISVFYPPADRPKGKPRLQLMAARRGTRLEREGWRVRKDGTKFWSTVALTSLRDGKGRLRGYCKIARDVSEQRQAQEVLQRSEEELSSFFAQSPLALFWISPSGRVRRINRAGLMLLGRTEKECKAQYLSGLFADRAIASALLKRLGQKGEIRNHRARLKCKDGRIRHVLIDANGLWREGAMVHSRWFVRDITPRVKLERKLLDVAEREGERLGSDLHDDICQQLAGIEFLSQTLAGHLREKAQPEAAQASDIAGMVREAMRHTRELAHGLSPMPRGTVGLKDALDQLAGHVRKTFRVNCRLHCKTNNVSDDGGLGIHIYRIAQEAVTNAVKHGRAQRIDIILRCRRHKLTMVVRDNGVGMPRRLREGKEMGLRALKYRAAVIGGSLTLKPNPRGGTEILCEVTDPGLKLNKGKPSI
jgi:PAS domain S-box-containing protein